MWGIDGGVLAGVLGNPNPACSILYVDSLGKENINSSALVSLGTCSWVVVGTCWVDFW